MRECAVFSKGYKFWNTNLPTGDDKDLSLLHIYSNQPIVSRGGNIHDNIPEFLHDFGVGVVFVFFKNDNCEYCE